MEPWGFGEVGKSNRTKGRKGGRDEMGWNETGVREWEGGRGIHEIRVVKSGKEQREPGSGKRELDFRKKGNKAKSCPKDAPSWMLDIC